MAAAVRPGRRGASAGPTAEHLGTALATLASSDVATNTVVFAVGATVLSVVLGTWLAWMTERTDLRLRGLVYVLAAVPMVVPGVLTTSAWRLLLSDSIGVVNTVLAAVGVDGVRTDPHTMAAMIWVVGTDGLTLPFLLVAVALRRLDPTLEEAALVAGARRDATIRVVLPLIAPALAAATLVAFVRNLGDFEGPVLLGLPGGVRVLSSETYLLVRTFPLDAELAAAFAVLLLLPSLLGLAAYLRVSRGSGRFASIGGRSRPPLRRALRRPRAATAAVLGVLGVAVVVPLLLLVYASLLPFYTAPDLTALPTFTLRNYAELVDAGPVLARTLRNTFVAVTLAAVVAVVLGALAARGSVRPSGRLRSLLDPIATTPVALPGVVLGLSLLWVYLRVPVPLYGTLSGVGVGLAVFALPYATRVMHTALLRTAPELEDAAAVAGAGPLRVGWSVVLPLALPGVVVAALVTAVRTAQVLSVPLLVGGPGEEVIAVRTFTLYEAGRIPEASALGVAMVVVLGLVTVLARGADAGLRRRWGATGTTTPVPAAAEPAL